MTVYTDEFDRADGSLGAHWVTNGSLAIVDQQVASSSSPSAAWYADALDADQTVTITLGVVNGVGITPQWSLTVRSNTQNVSTSTAYYQAALYFNDPDWLYLIDSSTNSISQFDIALGDTPAPGDTFELSAVGSTITLKFNDVTLFTTTDTDIPSGSYAGFSIDQATIVTEGTVDAAAVTAANIVALQTFTPPSFGRIPTTLPVGARGYDPIANALQRNYRARQEGTNVYYLSDGTVTETDPDSTTVFWHSYDGSPYVARVFWGSTADPYELSSAEATALTLAGYTVT